MLSHQSWNYYLGYLSNYWRYSEDPSGVNKVFRKALGNQMKKNARQMEDWANQQELEAKNEELKEKVQMSMKLLSVGAPPFSIPNNHMMNNQ